MIINFIVLSVLVIAIEWFNWERSAKAYRKNETLSAQLKVAEENIENLRDRSINTADALIGHYARLLDIEVRLDAIDLWIQKQASRRSTNGRFTKQKRS